MGLVLDRPGFESLLSHLPQKNDLKSLNPLSFLIYKMGIIIMARMAVCRIMEGDALKNSWHLAQ